MMMSGFEILKLDEGYWYLASPYSKYKAGLEIAFIHVSNVAGELLKHGVHTYCPISHTHPIACYGGLDLYSHDMFMPLDEQFMKNAHGMLIVEMEGWDKSYGIQLEIDFFKQKNRPIYNLEHPILKVKQ